jgi:riboflavin synthase
MFSGIIKCTGKIESIVEKGTTRVLTISSPISSSFTIDQSISHDGVCLTVVEVAGNSHKVEVIDTTISKSRLGYVKAGDVINLERSISASTLLDGHLVQGHVDTIVKCISITDLNGSWKIDFSLPGEFAALVIPQGSICINGVSLTVSHLTKDSFSVSIIPYTYGHTNFKFLRDGDYANVEFDLVGKYIIRQMELRSITE